MKNSGFLANWRGRLRLLAQHPHVARIIHFLEGDPLAFAEQPTAPLVRARFRAEQLSDLERSTSIAMATTCFGALMLAMAMWSSPRADEVRLWALMIVLLAGLIYARRVSAQPPTKRTASPNGIWRATANALLHGSLWACLPIFFYSAADAQQQFAIACISMATMYTGGFALGMIPVAMLAHVLPIAIGTLVTLLIAQNPFYSLVAATVTVYSVVTMAAASSRARMAARRCASEVAAEEGALRDELTQLPNRVAFRDELARAFARHSRQNERFALMCFDLDCFKNVNDSMGHEIGDAVLREAAARVRTSIRETDMVARLGGDEFALIAGDIRSIEDATSIAERIIGAFSAPFEIMDRTLPVSVSIGVAIAPSDGVDPESLMRNADSAMYATKQSGRCGFTFFRDRFGFVAERNTLDAELERAFAKNELFMVFQPFVDTQTLKTMGFEALLRWRHPVRGVLSAAEVIPLFERAGKIDAVGAWALEESVAIAATWPDHLRVAVNVSALQLRKPDFERSVVNALAKSGLDPRRLELELTESAMILDGEKAYAMLTSLRRLGIRTALDDLGTGYSSLANLVGLPLDRVKIDRSFIANLESNPMCGSVVKLSVELARSLSLEVTAEGVEDLTQLELLRAYGCREAQGYLFSQPRPANQLTHLLESCPVVARPDAPVSMALAG